MRSSWREASGKRGAVASTRRVKHDPRLLDAFDAVIDDLRRRVGQTFTLEELAQAYDAAEHWARTAIADRAAFPGWPRSLTDVLDAAFHLYARGATDYAP